MSIVPCFYVFLLFFSSPLLIEEQRTDQIIPPFFPAIRHRQTGSKSHYAIKYRSRYRSRGEETRVVPNCTPSRTYLKIILCNMPSLKGRYPLSITHRKGHVKRALDSMLQKKNNWWAMWTPWRTQWKANTKDKIKKIKNSKRNWKKKDKFLISYFLFPPFSMRNSKACIALIIIKIKIKKQK